MEAIGWEITPAGWIVLFLVVACVAHEIIRLLRLPPNKISKTQPILQILSHFIFPTICFVAEILPFLRSVKFCYKVCVFECY